MICDVHVLDRLKNDFEEMPPIFKNVEVWKQDVGPYMADLCNKLIEFKTPRHSLISSFFGHQIMLATPLLMWYDKHGLVIDSVTDFIRYKPVHFFKDFTEEVANARQAADESRTGTSESNTQKLIGELTFLT